MPPCKVDIDFSTFRNESGKACKRHRNLKANELQALFASTEKDYLSVGTRIQNLGEEVHVRKIRVGCQKDKVAPSNGYRAILQIIDKKNGTEVIGRFLSFYYKPEVEDINAKQIAALMKDAVAQKTQKSQQAAEEQAAAAPPDDAPPSE